MLSRYIHNAHKRSTDIRYKKTIAISQYNTTRVQIGMLFACRLTG